MRMEVDLRMLDSVHGPQALHKRRRISVDGEDTFLSSHVSRQVETSLPTLQRSDYYTKPCLSELAIQEFTNPGYCSRVLDFTVGRVGYGWVKFVGETDIRCLDLDNIIKFNRCEVIVYEDESSKPVVGQDLNKKAEVTLVLRLKPLDYFTEVRIRKIVRILKHKAASQGAQFLSFDLLNGEWKFFVQHFSRFGLSEDEEDIVMNDVSPEAKVPTEMNDNEDSDVDEVTALEDPTLLSHSLPAHLRLDPIRMKELRMLLFPAEEVEAEGFSGVHSRDSPPFAKEPSMSPLHHSSSKTEHKMSPHLVRKTPLALIEYNPGSFSSNCQVSMLMAQQNKGLHLKAFTSEGFKLDLKLHKTPLSGSHSHIVVDAALFMGRSFRVGWGPNGVLVHSGMPVGSAGAHCVLTSVINLQKVAIDNVIRDESNKVNKELIDLCFDSPLNLHKQLNHEIKRVDLGTFDLKLQKLVCNRLTLPEICRSYIEIIEKQLEVSSLPRLSRVLFMHQEMVWELVKVLFSSKKMSAEFKSLEADDEEDMVPDGRQNYPEVDLEALPLIRRAEFSYWLQESVYHRVQEDISSLDESSDLEHIFLLLTGRQLDAAVELAASRGDVRLSCLLSQAGGSPATRSDIAFQLDIWRKNGMDFNFFEENRKLLDDGNAPYPVPVYVDEEPIEEAGNWEIGEHFDLAYYLMLFHARQEDDFGALKTMFSAFASTNDPLDYHMIWHHRAVLEAIGTFSSNDLHVLDMGFVSQLLCVGQCHWAIYVVLHMTHREDYPYLQTSVIREILFQYCEVWSTQDSQWRFIESLGVPSSWLHEALAIYFSYNGDLTKALHHFIESSHWQKAHSIFFTSVAHSLFLSAKHSEIWRLATTMEDHKSEIEDWDLGAGIFISFYVLRSSLQEDSNTMTELGALENKNDECTDFIVRLNKCLAVSSSKLSLDARVVYSKMAEEVCSLLLSHSGEGSSGEIQLSCFNTVFTAPIPENLQSYHLQDVVSLFTSCLSEMAQ